jgi:hypothetical protein
MADDFALSFFQLRDRKADEPRLLVLHRLKEGIGRCGVGDHALARRAVGTNPWVDKFGRLRKLLDLERDRICAPHALRRATSPRAAQRVCSARAFGSPPGSI